MSNKSNQVYLIPNTLLRYILIISGTISLGLGIIGIFLPILPTTPFLLLAAACYARSSKRFYDWLLNNKWFGIYIKNYQQGKGIPFKVKVISISVLWITILTSTFFFITMLWMKFVLIFVAIAITIHISKMKTYIEN